MLKEEIEQRAKEKVLSKICDFPQFTHAFFTKNESVSYTTKRNYCHIFNQFLNYIKKIYSIEDIFQISPNVLENLSLENIYVYRDELLEKYSAKSVNSKLRSISGIFKFLYCNNIINKNIMSQVIITDVKQNKLPIEQTKIESLFESISIKKNEFIRKRNLSLTSIIIDTGLSLQDVVELNISNVNDDKIIYENNGNRIQYILSQRTINFLNQYLDMINTDDSNNPLYLSVNHKRISGDAIKDIFKKYGDNICPSNFQAKPSVRISDTHKYVLTIKSKRF